MKDFRNLSVWQRAHDLVQDAYKATASFPGSEAYGLTSQLRRSAISIPSNVAEGCGRSGDAELGRFLNIAMGSASELEYQVLLAQDLGYLEAETHEVLISEIGQVKRMLSGLIKRIRADR